MAVCLHEPCLGISVFPLADLCLLCREKQGLTLSDSCSYCFYTSAIQMYSDFDRLIKRMCILANLHSLIKELTGRSIDGLVNTLSS